MSEQMDFNKNILENMSDGVMTMEKDGTIVMFNPAGAQILGLDRQEVIGRRFAEVFLMQPEGNDEFNQTILDAIYESAVGQNTVVSFARSDGSQVYLSVTSSYLKDETTDNKGVIVVFSDITKTKELQEAEKKLRRDIEDAYIKVEESNANLQSAIKKMQFIRTAASAFVIVLFVLLGLYVWNKKPVTAKQDGRQAGRPETGSDEVQTIVVQPTPLSQSISLSGNLDPLEVVNIIVPFDATIQEKHFQYGQAVQKGDVLLELDTSDIEVKVRDAKAAYIKALHNYRELEDWKNGREVSRARRSLTKAKRNLDKLKRKLDESKILYEKGIDSANDYESAREQYRNSEMDYRAAQEEMETVLRKGSPENVSIARMELENAEKTKRELENKFEKSKVVAPVSGVIIQPKSVSKGENKDLEIGSPVKEGTVMVAVGNLEGMTVHTKVDEVDIGQLAIGQSVSVFGDAFPGVYLDGTVGSISFQASRAGGDIALFDVSVMIRSLSDAQRSKVRLGMSCNLEVIVYEKPDALMVPIEAVHTNSRGERTVTIKKGEDSFEDIVIQTGMTTLTSVEVEKGLRAGSEIVINP